MGREGPTVIQHPAKRAPQALWGEAASSAAADRQPDTYELQYEAQLDTNHDGVVSLDELRRFGAARGLTTWIPLSSMLATERRLAIDSPQFATNQQMLAKTLVKARGTANQADVDAVVATLVHLPVSVLLGMQRAGLSIAVCRGGVTDYVKQLRGAPVRGHDKSDTWDTVPGTSWGNEVVIATVAGAGGSRVVPPRGSYHGSYDVVLHELGHAIVRHTGQFLGVASGRDGYDGNATPTFLAARAHDWDRLIAYYQQNGTGKGAGADETFAESFARFYGNDPALQSDWPALYRFWDEGTRRSL